MNAPAKSHGVPDLSFRASFRHDLAAGLVVFLVALPLCLGIALASGAPLFSGIIAGICGGLFVPLISRAPLSVSGPAAGLTAIVLSGIESLGSFQAFMLATFLAGVMQVGLGLIKAGNLGSLVPSSVIKGMLAAIGLILILKQIPHAIGYDVELFGSEAFAGPEGENTFTLFLHSLAAIEIGAVIVSAASAAVLALWAFTPIRRLNFLPGPLAVVVVGVLANEALRLYAPEYHLGASHLVDLPAFAHPVDFFSSLSLPDFGALLNPDVFAVAVTVALVASVETMLSVEAIDKLDPFRRSTPRNRELVAQGVANSVSGLIGGLPVTSVIVRSSANLTSGGRTRSAAFIHGIFLLTAVMFAGEIMARIPLACLAVILLQIGYKLIRPSLVLKMYKFGREQFVPFAVTIVAIMVTDLLRGVIVGLVVGLVFVLRRKTHRSFSVLKDGTNVYIRFNKDVSFIHRGTLKDVLQAIPAGSRVVVDANDVSFVDFDIEEELQNLQESAQDRNLEVYLRGRALHEDSALGPSKTQSSVEPVAEEHHNELPQWAQPR